MAYAIPRYSVYSIDPGQKGLVVWALQRVCNRLGIPTKTDGIYDINKDEVVVKKLQAKLGVGQDGKVGPTTSRALAAFLSNKYEDLAEIPTDLLLSKILYESGGHLGAVNWSVPGGVDCCITQRRVYDSQFSDEALVKRAFDADYQVRLSADSIASLYGIFSARPGCRGNRELSYRTSTLNHNYPALADAISRYGIKGLSDYYRSPQTWVMNHKLVFPDGHPIRTPLEWGQRYAIGNALHNEPGQACKLVKDWS